MALQLFHGLRGFALSPDIVSYGAAAGACERGAQWRLALRYLQLASNEKVHVENGGVFETNEGEWRSGVSLGHSHGQIHMKPMRAGGFPCAATYIASSHGIRRHLSYGGVGSWPWVVFGGPLKPTCVEGPDRVSGGDEGPRAMFKCGVRARM